ncbi:hypothetical protein [Desertibacillus haloalkaliphilus]|uniref:hypothetical protein n=1 Tax=Desertibacillus haloalkaliphilus TaxID=1328930 RepID=UPI001C26EF1A|nr:hypothetical protein [Desertibacillus haloalkaliphilus]MBU8907599.1 hypothetical protein [Desertibacillus haloalkaliphilus]
MKEPLKELHSQNMNLLEALSMYAEALSTFEGALIKREKKGPETTDPSLMRAKYEVNQALLTLVELEFIVTKKAKLLERDITDRDHRVQFDDLLKRLVKQRQKTREENGNLVSYYRKASGIEHEQLTKPPSTPWFSSKRHLNKGDYDGGKPSQS